MTKSIVLFDGVCVLCRGSVRFIIRRDPAAHFQFASIQSDVGQQLCEQYHINHTEIPTTMVLITEEGQAFSQSTAALTIAKKLRWPWPLMAIFLLVPALIRNAVYQFIGHRRYRWFGKLDSCWIPSGDDKSRFL